MPLAELRVITPDDARSLLEKNTDNFRKLNERTVKAIADDITAGNWKLTHQGIGFDTNGKLVDGQHRLAAIAKAGIPVPIYVFEGLEPDTEIVIDSGIPRSNAQHMARLGFTSGNETAAALRAIYTIKTDPMAHRPRNMPTRSTVVELANLYGDNVYAWLRHAVRIAEVTKIPRSGVMTGLFLIAESGADRDAMENFVTQMQTGENLSSGSSILHFRRLGVLDSSRKNLRRNTVEVAALVVKVWNSYIQDKPMGVLNWKVTEPFPKVVSGNA